MSFPRSQWRKLVDNSWHGARCEQRLMTSEAKSILVNNSREPTYQAARAVAGTVETHFAHYLAQARARGEQELAPEPSARTIERIIDATFWASLRREEGNDPKTSLAFLSPEQADRPIIFERRLPLTPPILTKLAPAVERPGIHLGVWCEQNELYVWGATRSVPSLCFVLEVVEPGLLVIKHRRDDGFGKFANVAVLKGDQVKVIDENGTSLPDCPALLTSLLNFTSPSCGTTRGTTRSTCSSCWLPPCGPTATAAHCSLSPPALKTGAGRSCIQSFTQ